MRKYLLVALMLLFCQILFSQELNPNNTDKNIKKTKAILFNFNGFNLSGLNGGIGSKIWLSNTIVFKNILNIQYNSDKQYYNSSENNTSTYSTGIDLFFEKHIKTTTNFSPYFIIGSGVSYRKTTYIEVRELITKISNKYIDKQYAINGSVGFGVEYYIRNNISLSGEYLLYASYSKIKRNYYNEDPARNVLQKSFSDRPSGLILSIYF